MTNFLIWAASWIEMSQFKCSLDLEFLKYFQIRRLSNIGTNQHHLGETHRIQPHAPEVSPSATQCLP